ncbi:hypothetical protein A4G20_07960 [Pasteurellaceae bacterium RH1A]|nr:hypothetical protein A4G20_07960 [Pasteurellaceae bacterium RH1A]
MFNKTRLSLILGASLILPSCTLMLWERDKPYSTYYSTQVVAEDQIHSFAVVKSGHQQAELPAGSLIMMSGQHWFVLEPQDSQDLIKILSAKLNKAFDLTYSCSSDTRLQALPVTLHDAKSNQFTSDFCLSYQTSKAQEKATLKNLGFKLEKDGRYTYEVAAKGRYYATPQAFKADYKFETRVPVKISLSTRTTKLDGDTLAENLFLTPLTLATDLIILPLGAVGALGGLIIDGISK